MVEASLAAARSGDLAAVVAVLAPDVVRRADRFAVPAERPAEVRGAGRVSEEIAAFGRVSRFAEAALINGEVGVVVAPRGRLLLAIAVTVRGDRISV